MFGRRKRVLDKYVRRSFVVTQLDGTLFQGALVDWDSERLEFVMVKVFDPESERYLDAAPGPFIVDLPVKVMQRVSVTDVT